MMAGEGGRLELHRTFGPGRVRPRMHARQVEVPLVDSTVPMAASTVHGRPGHVAAACCRG